MRPVPGLGRSAVGQACEDHGGEGVTRKKIGDVMGPGYVDEVGGGRESGGGVAPRSTPLPSKDAAANPAACPLRIQGEGEAAHDERIRELEAEATDQRGRAMRAEARLEIERGARDDFKRAWESEKARVAAMEKALCDHCGKRWYMFDEFALRGEDRE